ncbi:MAG: c-type cytochrome [Proteobacteria bacterium]|nr:c-type cytochrome [Pseudomonadota bacterium]
MSRLALSLALLIAGLGATASVAAQAPAGPVADPGPRGGAPAAGGALPGLGAAERAFFRGALAQFMTVDSVTGSMPGETGSGLSPRFNGNFCAGCHAYPAAGGSSPPTNPQVSLATLDGAKNLTPGFIYATGPVREARFVRNPDGTPDGSVHDLFTITGRRDAAGCRVAQPDFAAQVAAHNVALRIPTGVFGLGLVENTPDDALVADDRAHAIKKALLGIAGHFNRSANDGTIMRFGWKAQDKSLLVFAGEAYNVEQGVTNELFPNERETHPDCQFTAQPEDATFFTNTIHSGSTASDLSSATVNFAGFMRLSTPPTPATPTPSTLRGQQLFVDVGCEACHSQTHKTTRSIYTAQSFVTYHPYSDFEVHKMGTGLADGITQGSADGSEFRTAPLWGLGQRLFFLHDGRTSDVLAAIQAHASPGSEADLVIRRFNALTPAQRQDILNFLRSL